MIHYKKMFDYFHGISCEFKTMRMMWEKWDHLVAKFFEVYHYL